MSRESRANRVRGQRKPNSGGISRIFERISSICDPQQELPKDFHLNIVDPVWHELLSDPDRKKARAAFRAGALTAARRGLKGGRLWIDHSWEHRSREAC